MMAWLWHVARDIVATPAFVAGWMLMKLASCIGAKGLRSVVSDSASELITSMFDKSVLDSELRFDAFGQRFVVLGNERACEALSRLLVDLPMVESVSTDTVTVEFDKP